MPVIIPPLSGDKFEFLSKRVPNFWIYYRFSGEVKSVDWESIVFSIEGAKKGFKKRAIALKLAGFLKIQSSYDIFYLWKDQSVNHVVLSIPLASEREKHFEKNLEEVRK